MTISRRTFLATSAAAAVAATPLAASATAKKVTKWDKTVDVVVIGSGGAGLATAVSAAEHGVKNIVVLEKLAFIGGNTSIATGAFNTAVGLSLLLSPSTGLRLQPSRPGRPP